MKHQLFMFAVVGAVCSFLVVGAIAINRDTERWEKFKRDHHCVLVDKDGWRCDDNVTYYR